MTDAYTHAPSSLLVKAGILLRDQDAMSALHGAILDHAALSIIATTTEGVITCFNPAAERMLGYRAEEMLGLQTPEIIHDLQEVVARAAQFGAELGIDLEPGFEVFVARARRNLANEYEWTYIRKDGTRMPVLLSVTALRDGDGEITGFLGIGLDITNRKQTEAALRISHDQLNEAQRIAMIGSWSLDLVNNQLEWSDEIFRIFEIDRTQFGASYESFLSTIHPEDRDRVNQAYTDSLANRQPYEITHRLLFADGRIKYVHERCETLYAHGDGLPILSRGTVQDITASIRAEQDLRLYANIFEHSGEAILVCDSQNRVVALNQSFTQLTGYTLDEIRGKNPRILASSRTSPGTYQAMWAALHDTGFWQGELWDRRKDGSVYPKWVAISVIRDASGNIAHYIASFVDISERKAAEERIYRLAHHDALTGLVNRFSLEERLQQALLSAQRAGRQGAVLFIDMDRFKTINDTLGHHVGDELLIEVAKRLQASVRESDIVARLGGDEFVVVLTSVASGMNASAGTAGKIVRRLGEMYRIEGNELYSSPSIGISSSPTTATVPPR